MVNERGGLPVGGEKIKIDVVTYDERSNPAGALDTFNKIIVGDGVKIIFGPVNLVKNANFI